ncbi:hypothetical protein LWI28_011163 [Acer negundo]|uniref:RING-type domain-containing protein n=1 Tax=Acer negundo TaxID=4023 RepID=A0AAD5ITP9_ACENE|nr:hypothetical protein LWI28_011163 [Acer negundo]
MVLPETLTSNFFNSIRYWVIRILCCCCTNQEQIGGPRKTIVGNSVLYNSHERIGQEYSDCVICVEDFKDGDRCGVLYKCEHVYHIDCINKWLTKSKHCPLCRCYVIDNSSTPSKKRIS